MGDEPREGDGQKVMIESYDVWDRQISQEEANYSADGGLRGNPCAVCRWFVSPNGCIIVSDFPEPINPIGTSDRFEAKTAPEVDAVPVMIVEEGEAQLSTPDPATPLEPALTESGLVDLRIPESIKEAVVGFARKLLPGVKEIGTADGIRLFKQKDGSLRWFMWATNKWEDREGEIFEDAAHKEFIEYLDNTRAYPEAWLWHTPGTRWGAADWADYADGFFVYSGTVDPGMESVATKLANEDGLGVSHGFKYLYSDKNSGIIGWYRTYELSALPLSRAANLWTGIEFIAEAKAMGFSEARRKWLTDYLGETKVAELEGDTNGAKTILEGMGVAWKDGEEFEDEADAADADADTGNGSGGNQNTFDIDYDRIAESAVKALEESDGFKAVGDQVKAINSRLSDVEADIKTLKESDDEKIAAVFAPKANPSMGHRASTDRGNVVAQGEDADKELDKRGPVAPQFMSSITGVDPNKPVEI